MQVETLTKVTARDAQEICTLAALGGFTLAPKPGASPPQFLTELLTMKAFNEAVQFLAFALPPREAVWWACLCARSVLLEPAPPLFLAAVEAAEAWVRRPTDENRRVAMVRAQATKFDAPAAWAAVGAFWSGGSLAPAELPVVPVPAHLAGIAVAGAVTLAAVQTEPERADLKRERYLAAAIDIANGGPGRDKLNGD